MNFAVTPLVPTPFFPFPHDQLVRLPHIITETGYFATSMVGRKLARFRNQLSKEVWDGWNEVLPILHHFIYYYLRPQDLPLRAKLAIMGETDLRTHAHALDSLRLERKHVERSRAAGSLYAYFGQGYG